MASSFVRFSIIFSSVFFFFLSTIGAEDREGRRELGGRKEREREGKGERGREREKGEGGREREEERER